MNQHGWTRFPGHNQQMEIGASGINLQGSADFRIKHSMNKSLFPLLVILLTCPPATIAGPEEETCLSCHQTLYDKAMVDFYIHRTFLEKKCLDCHGEGKTQITASDDRSSSRHADPQITWLQRHFGPATTHYFLVPADKVDDTLFVQTKGKNRRPQTSSISLPPLGRLPQYVNDGKVPEIFDIRFNGVKQGILLSASISWETDEPSDAQIHYGIGSFTLKSKLDHQLRSYHRVDISPLSPGKTYSYAVVSKDIYGNEAISQTLTFSTEKTAYIKSSVDEGQSRTVLHQKALRHELAAVGEQYFMTITATRPTYMKIGSRRYLHPKIRLGTDSNQTSPPANHVPRRNSYDINIGSCLGCHKNYQSKSSHPVNVRPKGGMTFPDDYPLLEDGGIHCMTCHEQHSSNHEARIRRPTKQELCIGCHKNYG